MLINLSGILKLDNFSAAPSLIKNNLKNIPSKPFEPSLMFASKAGAANVRPGENGLPGTNTLAYYENPQMFYRIAPGLISFPV